MQTEYLELASRRAQTRWEPYLQPEDFGYDFREWVSPYTKGAHARGGFALVLQDWVSADSLAGAPDPDIQRLGRAPTLKTNSILEQLLRRVLDLRIEDVYATNAFPFIKPGGMSSAVPIGDLVWSVRQFAAPELSLVEPTTILALGAQTHTALSHANLHAIALPHPAARGLSLDAHELKWRNALGELTHDRV